MVPSFLEITAGSLEPCWIVSELPDSEVARIAEESSDSASDGTVVNRKLESAAGELAADGAPPLLAIEQVHVLLAGDSVGSPELGPSSLLQASLGLLGVVGAVSCSKLVPVARPCRPPAEVGGSTGEAVAVRTTCGSSDGTMALDAVHPSTWTAEGGIEPLGRAALGADLASSICHGLILCAEAVTGPASFPPWRPPRDHGGTRVGSCCSACRAE